MLAEAITFIHKNTRTKIIIDNTDVILIFAPKCFIAVNFILGHRFIRISNPNIGTFKVTLAELSELLTQVQNLHAETQTLELKSPAPLGNHTIKVRRLRGCFASGIFPLLLGYGNPLPLALQDVYDAQDLVKHVTEQCNQMTPVIRPVFTTLAKDNKVFVSTEIPRFCTCVKSSLNSASVTLFTPRFS